MQLFYSPHIQPTDTLFSFNKEESRHMVKVLRKKEGETLYITDGKGKCYEACIKTALPNQCTVQIITTTEKPKSKYRLHLAVAPTKLNDRFEWFLEKATEIGIHEITPVLCDHSERKVIKEERYAKILQSAMKQSLRFELPKLNPLTRFSDFLNMHKEGKSAKYIAHCYNGDKQNLKNITPNGNYTILIGPEGDFSEAEVAQAQNKGYTPIDLGEYRLRTETAAIISCQNIAFIHN